jgi:hypothetical protein
MQKWLALCVSAVACIYIVSHYVDLSPKSFYQNVVATYSSAWAGIQGRVTRSNWPQAEWINAIAALKEEAKFPLLQGTTDIYSFHQTYLIASANVWDPRPDFVSHNVYNRVLAEKNKEHLLGDKAPDNVIFKVEPLDGRLPSLEDGPSWPVLLTRYRPNAVEDGFLYLRKLQSTSEQSDLLPVGGDSVHKFGDVIAVPDAASPIFAELAIRLSILGRLEDTFFKPTELQIALNLENGTTKTYRFITEMAKSDFMISPLVQDTGDFVHLYGGKRYLDDRAVKSFVIVPVGGTQSWEGNFKVIFKQMSLPPAVDISNFYKFDPIEDSARLISTADRCDGGIDSINGATPGPSGINASGVLRIDGWLAKSAEQAALPQSVLVVLTDDNGTNTFIRTRQEPRPDVAAFFRKPALAASGYTSVIDVSMLGGNYTLGLSFAEGDHIERCPQVKIPITLKKARR